MGQMGHINGWFTTGHGSMGQDGSWVTYTIGQMGHGSRKVTHGPHWFTHFEQPIEVNIVEYGATSVVIITTKSEIYISRVLEV